MERRLHISNKIEEYVEHLSLFTMDSEHEYGAVAVMVAVISKIRKSKRQNGKRLV